MCHSTQYEYARIGKDTFDFKPVFRKIKKYFDESDFSIGNFETVVAGRSRGYAGYPVFNSPDELLEGLSYAGFDALTTANNHATDGRKDGLLRTIDKINHYGMHPVGTFTSKEDRDSIRIFKINEISFTILSYTYGVNIANIPANEKYLLNFIDTIQIRNDIEKAKKSRVDITLVYFHFGNEYKGEPEAYQKEIVKKTFSYGADIILGASPHVLQPIDFYSDPKQKIDTGFVAYSLGNFVSNQRWRYSDGGVVLKFSISKSFLTGSVYLNKVEFLPIWVFKGKTDSGSEYIILPSQLSHCNDYPEYLLKKDLSDMKQSFEDTKAVLTKYSIKPRLQEIDCSQKISN